MASNIEWTEDTWNPLGGCKEVGPECTNCYAAPTAARLEAMANADIAAGRDPGAKRKYIGATHKTASGKVAWSGKINLAGDADADFLEPLRTKKPTTYFVNSMSDLFHEDVPDEFIDRVFAVMALCRQHTFQVLTKRPERMAIYMAEPNRKRLMAMKTMGISNYLAQEAGSYKARISLDDFSAAFKGSGPFPNVWLGVSCGNRKDGLPRIEYLRRTPAAIRFLSCEPLLEDLGEIDLTGIDWCIVGGESGHGARPCNIAWIRSLIAQCKAARVACFVKQLGTAAYDGPNLKGTGIKRMTVDRKGGNPDEWSVGLRVREYPEARS